MCLCIIIWQNLKLSREQFYAYFTFDTNSISSISLPFVCVFKKIWGKGVPCVINRKWVNGVLLHPMPWHLNHLQYRPELMRGVIGLWEFLKSGNCCGLLLCLVILCIVGVILPVDKWLKEINDDCSAGVSFKAMILPVHSACHILSCVSSCLH